VIDHGMSMHDAVAALRFHSEEGQLLFVEPGFSDQTIEALRDLGNDVQRSTYMSRVQAIRITSDGTLEAGADPRGGRGIGRFPDSE
jgi:gamma-glutamyltranspeptidase / glutathione hydrolase